jgi:hypothetical protein
MLTPLFWKLELHKVWVTMQADDARNRKFRRSYLFWD